jgi:hypothetical protein
MTRPRACRCLQRREQADGSCQHLHRCSGGNLSPWPGHLCARSNTGYSRRLRLGRCRTRLIDCEKSGESCGTHPRLAVGGRSHLAPADLVRVTPAGSPLMQCCWVTFGQCVSADRYSVQVRRGHSPLGRNPGQSARPQSTRSHRERPAPNHLYSIVFCHSDGPPWQPRPSWRWKAPRGGRVVP